MTARVGRSTPKHPLAEVFGYPIDDLSEQARKARLHRLCPYNNHVPNCTKDKADDPLGVCSVFEDNKAVITCPVRFRQDWLVAQHAAEFFFSPGTTWTSLTEVRLRDAEGNPAGNIDVVLVSYDKTGRLLDFGALEIQAVYISGNVRHPFESYMAHQSPAFDWSDQPLYPRPDYLSSSRKRLAPQLLFKGGILKSWGKRVAVALDDSFFATLPALPEVRREEADVAWLIYTLERNAENGRFALRLVKTVYTEFNASLAAITVAVPGSMDEFLRVLQQRLNKKLSSQLPISDEGSCVRR